MFEKPEERNIYKFWNGEADVCVDPLPIWYGLGAESSEEGGFWYYHRLASNAGTPAAEKLAAQNKVHKRVCEMFGTVAFDGTKGLTMLESARLLADFMGYIDELKKRLESSQTPSQSTESKSSEESTTPPDADSSSKPSEPPSDEPL